MAFDTYITALAWIIGVIGVFCWMVALRGNDRDESIGFGMWLAIFAWAWLIGRYLKRWL